MTYTESQKEAIIWHDNSVLVSAGAGSGKTRVLTERLMRYITEEGEDVNRFLVITFTRAAAAELRGRIAAGITERLRDNPGDAHMRRQLFLCRSAQIGTIHSFCTALLREYAGEIGISPSFRILEEEKSERLRIAALERVLEASYQEANLEFLALADSVGAGRNDARLENLLLKLHSQMQSHAYPLRWLQEQMVTMDEEPEHITDTVWGKELITDLGYELDYHIREMDEARKTIDTDQKLQRAYGESFLQTVTSLRALRGQLSVGWDAAAKCFPVEFPKLLPIGKNVNRELAESVKRVRTRCKNAVEKMAELFSEAEKDTLKHQRETVPAMKALLRLTQKLEMEFQSAKHRANGLDFSDLEHLCLRLLQTENGVRTETAEVISRRFREIMVDEFQDVSRVQDSIFHAVSRENNLFFVGDLKQSIYRFRLADPGIFIENSRKLHMIRLRENFRSKSAILDTVNRVFYRCMSEKLGDMDYTEKDYLISGAENSMDGEVPELILIRKENAAGTDLDTEAELVAEKITEFIRSGRKPGEIAILLRSANTVGSAFRKALLARGIPVAEGAGEEFYSSFEVSVVLSFLSLLDNPHKDIPLLTVLRSPAFGLSDESLAKIRAASPESDYYTAIGASDNLGAKSFLEVYTSIRMIASDLRPVTLVNRTIEALGLYALCAAMPDSETKLKRLNDLGLIAERFESSGERGLHNFLLWLQNLEQRGEAPDGFAQSSDAVSILSVHRSKGLEFPIVFYSALARNFNKADSRDIVLIHPQLGFGPKYTDAVRKIEFPTASRRAIERFLNREMLSEEMRLMYVAMTRAKEQLIMTACVKKADDLLDQYEVGTKKLSPYQLVTASSPLHWLLQVLPAHIVDPVGKDHTEEQGSISSNAMEADPNLLNKIQDRLCFRYPWEKEVTLPTKLTASGLEDLEAVSMMPAELPSMMLPDMDKGINLTAARRGTAMHAVLQHIAFDQTASVEMIQTEITRLTDRGFLSKEEADSVSAEVIYRFFSSEIGKRIIRAEKIYREFRFSLLIEASRLMPDVISDEKILLQGVADCCFVEDGQLVIVDYKTDRYPQPEIYWGQLNAYAEALQRIFQIPVREKTLYFLSTGLMVSL